MVAEGEEAATGGAGATGSAAGSDGFRTAHWSSLEESAESSPAPLLLEIFELAMRAVPDAIADAVAVAGCAEGEAALTPTAALERPTLCGGPTGAAVAAASG